MPPAADRARRLHEPGGQERPANGTRLGAAPWIFMVLLLALAWLGAQNQDAFRRQAALLQRKAELQSSIASLRLEASAFSSPIFIGQWARSVGMVPAPQVSRIREIAPQPLPSLSEPLATGLELSTVWR